MSISRPFASRLAHLSHPGANDRKLPVVVVADRLAEALKEHKAGKTEVRSVELRLERDSTGENALYFVLKLANPARGQSTWPTEDLWALRRDMRTVKLRLEDELKESIGLPWFIVFEPEHPADLEADDLREVLTVDE